MKMENKNIDFLVKNSLNPFLIIKLDVEIKNISEFNDKLKNKLLEQGVDFLNELERDSIGYDISDSISYLFVRKQLLPKIKNILTSIDHKFTIKDVTDEFWEMDDLTDFFNKFMGDDDVEFTKQHFPEFISDRDKVRNILRLSFEKKYNVDNVLDKINEKGLNSLNEFNEYILKMC